MMTSSFGYGADHETPFNLGIHHVQLSVPEGSEDLCRTFWCLELGFIEVPKPPVLAARGGLWARADRLEIHLGVEKPFSPAKKAHPGILVGNIDALAERLARYGRRVEWDDNFPGHRRFYSEDPVGNRLEFLSPDPGRPAVW